MRSFLPAIVLAVVSGVSAQNTPATTTTVVPPPTSAPTSVTGAPQTAVLPGTSTSRVPGSGSTQCDAAPILKRCLETEEPKVAACDPTDYGCQCSAYEAVATCYNNCPDDPRRAPAMNQVTVFCDQASRTASLTPTNSSSTTGRTSTSTASSTTDDDGRSPTRTTATQENRISNTGTFETGDDEEGAASDLMRNTGGVLLGVAGLMAFIL